MMLRRVAHLSAIIGLTALTQLGGLAWLISLLFKQRLIAFIAAYSLLWWVATLAAPHFGRVPVSCFADGPLKVQSWLYCGLNRNYVAPELKQLLEDSANAVSAKFPGTKTLMLDGNFPFFDGFPLLPHLSHNDGEKADLAFYYQSGKGYDGPLTRSPIGYFAFEDGPTACAPEWLSLRWDLAVLQPYWRDLELEPQRTAFLLRTLLEHPQTSRVFLEPHLQERLRIKSPKLGFQGCRAARHDDHIHLQLR